MQVSWRPLKALHAGPLIANPWEPQHHAPVSEALLDVKGLCCPLPVLRANRMLRGMRAGEKLRVLATDPAAAADFRAYCRETGHALLTVSEDSGTLSFIIRRRVEAVT